MRIDRFEFEQASKLLTIPELKYFFITFINVSEPSVQYIPSTNSTSKGISTQKPEAKSQVSEIMAKQIIKPNLKGMCGKPAHFS